MKYLRNIDDDCFDEELENVFGVNEGADEELNDDMEDNVPNMGRVQEALLNIPVPQNGGCTYANHEMEGQGILHQG